MNANRSPADSPGSIFQGLYVILDESRSGRCPFLDVLREAATIGVKLVQYRNKTGSMSQAYKAAQPLRHAAAKWGMTFIVNDRCDLALALKADGLHLGQTDLSLLLAKQVVGDAMCIGISTHNADQVQLATQEGADYLGYGPIFPTTTKAVTDPVVGLQGLADIRPLTPLPIFAIGGITTDAAPALRAAGANGVAVASAILDADNRTQVMAKFMSTWQ